MMKRKSLLLLLALCLALLFAACGRDAATGYTAAEISQQIMQSQQALDDLQVLAMEDAGFADFLYAYYDLEEELLEDGVICYADSGADAREITVLRLKDGTDQGAVQRSLEQYIEARTASYWGYMPDQVLLLEQATIETSGNTIVLLVCDDPVAAGKAFASCFGGDAALSARALPVYSLSAQTEGNAHEVDTALILRAYRAGDFSTLTGKNRLVLELCAGAVDKLVTPDMSDFQKELVIHDWIIQRAAYDTETVNRSPNARPHPDNDNPYGLLVAQRGICTGYASTFQLFMDMLGIECITVQGTARSGANEHAWNMVRLDGEWYCVDVTWNDPVGLERYDAVAQHEYFNVTSKTMRASDHQWDETNVPESTATTYAWQPGLFD